MRRKTYVVEAENGVGMYISRTLMNEALRYLSNAAKTVLEFECYERAKRYIWNRYEDDPEIDLKQLRFNKTVYRDKSKRDNFYLQSAYFIGFGTDVITKLMFADRLGVRDWEIKSVGTTREAEYLARRGFVKEFDVSELLYSGPLRPGEALSLADVRRYNGLEFPGQKMVGGIQGKEQSIREPYLLV